MARLLTKDSAVYDYSWGEGGIIITISLQVTGEEEGGGASPPVLGTTA